MSKKRLGERATAFEAEVQKTKPGMSAGEKVLLEEACRLVDRLDRFDALLRGDAQAWAVIEWPYEDSPAALVIGSVVTEARQTVGELRQVVKALSIPAAGEGQKGGVLDELARRRGQRTA